MAWQMVPCVETAPFGNPVGSRGVQNCRVGIGIQFDAGHVNALHHHVGPSFDHLGNGLSLAEAHAEQARADTLTEGEGRGALVPHPR